MDFTHDGTVLASCSFDGLVRLWETHNGHCLKTLAIDNGASPLSHVCFSPNGEDVRIRVGWAVCEDAVCLGSLVMRLLSESIRRAEHGSVQETA
jgi:WD40 repeat protein